MKIRKIIKGIHTKLRCEFLFSFILSAAKSLLVEIHKGVPVVMVCLLFPSPQNPCGLSWRCTLADEADCCSPHAFFLQMLGNGTAERTAASLFALCGNGAAVQGDQSLHNGQAQSGALVLANQAISCHTKFIENIGQILLRNAYAGVGKRR